MKLLLKSATIIDPTSSFHLSQKDILIENGYITSIENEINTKVDNKIELKNLHVSQGWFDSSVSFGEPGYEDRETLQNGLDTAMKSGFTKVVLNPNTYPIIDHSALIQYVANNTKHHIVDLLPSGALTEKSKSEQLAELFDMYKHGAVIFGDYKKSITNSNLFKIALQYAKSFDALIQAYPTENSLSQNTQMHEGPISTILGLKASPNMAEVIQLQRDLELVKYTKGKLHISCISTAESVGLIKAAKKQGLDVTCSVALSNLLYTDEKLLDFDTKYKIWPPLREASDQKALIKGLKDGIIDMVTSDHQPLNVELKKTEFEHAKFGSIGLEAAFGSLCKKFGLENSIDYLTRGKARFQQDINRIDINHQAELSLFNPDIEWTFAESDIYSKSKNAISIGEKLKGKAYGIINKNQYYASKQ